MDCSKKACKEFIVMKKYLLWFAALSFSALQMMNVKAYASSEETSSAQPASQPSAVQPAPQPSPQEDAPISGKVIETMTSGGYTYALIEKDGKKMWIASPAMNLTVGQEVSFMPGVDMGAFESRTLKRKFEDIIFS